MRNILSDSAKILIRIVRRCPPIRHIVRLCSDGTFDWTQGKFHELFLTKFKLFGLFVWTKSLQGYGRIFDQGRFLNSLWKTGVVPNFPAMMVEVLKVQFFKNYPRWPFKWRKNEKVCLDLALKKCGLSMVSINYSPGIVNKYIKNIQTVVTRLQ